MKIFTSLIANLIFFIITLPAANAQPCGCSTIREDAFDCDIKVMKNGATLQRFYNCEENWLFFKNKKRGINKIIYAGPADPRIGYVWFTEYEKVLLFQKEVISGCCTPPEFIMHDKNTGNEIKNLGELLYADLDSVYPYIIYLNDNQYEGKAAKLSHVVVQNVNTGKLAKAALPLARINYTMQVKPVTETEYLFDEAKLYQGYITVPYRYMEKNSDSLKTAVIKIKTP